MRSKRILRECACSTRVFPLHIVAYVFSLHPPLPVPILTSRIPAETIRSVLQSFRFIFRPSTRRWLQSWLSTHTPEVRLTLPGYGQPDSRGQLSRAVCSDASNNVVVPSASFVIEWFDPP